MKKIICITASLFLSACGSIGNIVISDQSLKEKSAFALHTTADKVEIVQRSAGLDDIRFIAKVGKRSYQCYITTVAGVISSDAICSGTNGMKSPTQCNELLRKAGRC